MTGRLRLDVTEAALPAWQKVRAYVDTRLGALDLMLRADLDPVETAKMRGRITELERLIRELDPSKAPPLMDPRETVEY